MTYLRPIRTPSILAGTVELYHCGVFNANRSRGHCMKESHYLSYHAIIKIVDGACVAQR